MAENLIPIKHHVDDYECMWNGIEDMYMTKTGAELPSFFFFALAGTGNFIYRRTPKSAVKRQAVWNDGRTKKMYARLGPTVGFHFQHREGKSFPAMLNQAKRLVDAGSPVVLGALDMYDLHYYPKFYHKEHIPLHYILMVGYHDEKQCVLVQDCGIGGVQEVGYADLKAALNVSYPGFPGKNGLCTIAFDDPLPDVREIAQKAFAQKAQNMLTPAVGFLGIKGMRKLAQEFGNWQKELGEDDYRAALTDMVTFTGTVPVLPDQLLPPAARSGVLHRAGREKLVHVLETLALAYQITAWNDAASQFTKSGTLLETMSDTLTAYLLGNRDELKEVPDLILEIADTEETGFRYLLCGAEE